MPYFGFSLEDGKFIEMNMEETKVLDALPDDDHQAALAIIDRLGDCQNRKQLNRVMKTALLPQMNCSAAFYALLQGPQYGPQLLGAINSTTICEHEWRNFLEIALQQQFAPGSRAGGMACRITTNAFCCTGNCQQCTLAGNCWQLPRCYTVMALFDAPRPTLMLNFCWIVTQDNACSLYEGQAELLHIIQAVLLQTIKAILYREHSQNLRQMLDHLCDHADPLVVVSDHGRLVYKNAAYDLAGGEKNTADLPEKLFGSMITDQGNAQRSCFLSRLGRRLYEVRITSFKDASRSGSRLHLLRWSRVTCKNEKISRQLSNAGLTCREQEIATLIHQNISPRQISERLHLSYHTVRNHIKHIYRKLGVTTRSEMLLWDE